MRKGTLDHLYDLAEGQDGYFSAAQAIEEGVTYETLAKAAKRGRLTRLYRAVYRLNHFPETSQNGHLWAALLWPQVRRRTPAALSHYTALQLHSLSDANPAQIHITVPIDVRFERQRPPEIQVHCADLNADEIMYVDGLPTTNVPRTLRDIAAIGDRVVLHDACRDARHLGLQIPEELLDA